ncbi:MAG: 2-amino-4-hydroxy-6-hydroxymethyldihydropteridine diphosphokinase [Planctomycetes bacterium]|nr:2-amino-4-hydroxy-6-hydroxymethyldihydropteridine diphosphokinase [Planctomycetota bacterium]
MSAVWVRSAVALGSNLGDREGLITNAIGEIAALEGIRNLRVSRTFETDPVGGPSGQQRYLNAAMVFETKLAPRALLSALQGIEARNGRDRSASGRDLPRTLDLDLLVYDDLIVEEDGLIVPHPRLSERAFVLEPLCAIAPDLVVPKLERSVRELLAALPARSNEAGAR